MEDRSYPVLLRERDARIKELERKLGDTEAMTAIIIRERDAAVEAANRLAEAVSDELETDEQSMLADAYHAYTQTRKEQDDDAK